MSDRTRLSILQALRLLMIFSIASLTLSVAANYISFGGLYIWISFLLSVLILYCIFCLRPVHKFYRLSSVFMAADLLLTLINRLFGSKITIFLLHQFPHEQGMAAATAFGNVVSTLIYAFGLIAVIFELIGHSSLVKPGNPRLCKQWRYVLVGYVGISLFMTVLSPVLVSMINKGTMTIAMYEQILPILTLPGVLMKLVYIGYLSYTVREIRKREKAMYER